VHVFTYIVYHFKYKFAGVGLVRIVTLHLGVPLLINTLNRTKHYILSIDKPFSIFVGFK
jgi:hypothetical protein